MQLTIRGFDKDLEQEIKSMAKREGISLNKVVLKLLRKATGLVPAAPEEPVVGETLDRFIGTWSEAEAEEFEQTVRDLDRVDGSLWR